jgi:pilus assembly protein CpaB
MRGRFSLVLVVAIIAGLIASALVYRTIGQIRASANKGPETEEILVAVSALEVADTITARDVRLVAWPRTAVPEGALRKVAEGEGRVIRRSVIPGEPILETKLAPPSAGKGGMLGILVPEGHRAVTIKVDDAVRESGLVVPNSRVDVIVSMPLRPDSQERVGKVILQDVVILAAGQTVEMRDNKPVPVTTVTLSLTPDQAERLALAQSDSRIILATRNYQDKSIVKTSGATRATLYEAVPAAAGTTTAAVVAKAAPVKKPAAPPAPVVAAVPLPPPPVETHTVAVLRAGKVTEEHVFVRGDRSQAWTEQGPREGKKP